MITSVNWTSVNVAQVVLPPSFQLSSSAEATTTAAAVLFFSATWLLGYFQYLEDAIQMHYKHWKHYKQLSNGKRATYYRVYHLMWIRECRPKQKHMNQLERKVQRRTGQLKDSFWPVSWVNFVVLFVPCLCSDSLSRYASQWVFCFTVNSFTSPFIIHSSEKGRSWKRRKKRERKRKKEQLDLNKRKKRE